jgi:hypothetical protein
MAIEKLEKQGSVGPLRSLLDDDDKHLATNTVAHVFPFNWCLAPWVLGRSFYDKIMFGIVQYVSFCVFSLLQFLKGEKLHDCCICNENFFDCNYIYYFISFPVSSLSGHTYKFMGGLNFR